MSKRHKGLEVDRGDLTELGAKILSIPSFKGEETALAYWLADFFDDRGYHVNLQEVEPGRFQTIATLRGDAGSPALMFNGHLDIDPLRAGWQRDPFVPEIDGDLLYGAGARNMKGGLASMITAAETIRKSSIRMPGDLVVACVAGELQGGVGTTYALRNGMTAAAAVIPEPFGADNVVTTTVGVLELAITCTGFSQHISRADEAVDPLPRIIQIIEALRNIEFRHTPQEDLPDLPRLVIGGIIGGRGDTYDLTGPNYTPDRCTLVVDVRYLPGQSQATVLADIRRSIERVGVPEADYEISFESKEPYVLNSVVFEPASVPVTQTIVANVSDAYEEINGKPLSRIGTVVPHSYCGADTAHLWQAGIPAILHGPSGPPRTPTEGDDCVYISEMLSVTRVLAQTAASFNE